MTRRHPNNAHDAPMGILNIDKPAGMTSHDVVARVRRLSGQRRVGHAGTLDPMATGVLVVCIGKATRIIEYLTETTKAYHATVHLGLVTDTWDAEGTIIAKTPCEHVQRSDLDAAMNAFEGEIEQIPPMYSALKRNGQPLYRLARQGITVERAPRKITIHAIDVVDWASPLVTLDIVCSKGTYVRAIAHDLGQSLGVGAHLAALRRTAVGAFRIQEAVTLDQLEAEREQGQWRRHLMPLHDALTHMPAVTVVEETIQCLRYGQAVSLDIEAKGPLLCAYDEAHQLIAVLQPGDEPGIWRPCKVLSTE